MANRLEIRLGSFAVHRSATPSTIDFKQLLAPLVKSVEEAISIEAGIYNQVGPKTQGSERLVLALTGVSEHTTSEATYEFAVGHEVEAAVGQITAGLAGLPDRFVVPDAARRVREGLTRAVNRGLSVQLVNGVATPVFSRDNLPPTLASHPTRRVESEVAVKLVWVGGKRPAARVELLSTKQIVSVSLPGQSSARELGHHLYRNAVLSGIGQWVIDPKQFFRPTRLLSFKVSSFRLLTPIEPEVLFNRFAQATGGVWDDTDPTKMDDEVAAEGEAS